MSFQVDYLIGSHYEPKSKIITLVFHTKEKTLEDYLKKHKRHFQLRVDPDVRSSATNVFVAVPISAKLTSAPLILVSDSIDSLKSKASIEVRSLKSSSITRLSHLKSALYPSLVQTAEYCNATTQTSTCEIDSNLFRDDLSISSSFIDDEIQNAVDMYLRPVVLPHTIKVLNDISLSKVESDTISSAISRFKKSCLTAQIISNPDEVNRPSGMILEGQTLRSCTAYHPQYCIIAISKSIEHMCPYKECLVNWIYQLNQDGFGKDPLLFGILSFFSFILELCIRNAPIYVLTDIISDLAKYVNKERLVLMMTWMTQQSNIQCQDKEFYCRFRADLSKVSFKKLPPFEGFLPRRNKPLEDQMDLFSN